MKYEISLGSDIAQRLISFENNKPFLLGEFSKKHFHLQVASKGESVFCSGISLPIFKVSVRGSCIS
jgi:hypothetical protein